MSQKSSVPQPLIFVSRVLTPDTKAHDDSLSRIDTQNHTECGPDGRDLGGGLEQGAQLKLAAGLKRTALCR